MQREPKGDGRRIPRVEKLIRETVGLYLLGHFRGDIEGTVVITRVIASRDLRNAKVLFTLMGEDSENKSEQHSNKQSDKLIKKAATQELQAHAYEFQREVNRRLQMKHCPRLSFHYDDGFEHAMRVENILRDLSRERASQDNASSVAPSASAADHANDPNADDLSPDERK